MHIRRRIISLAIVAVAGSALVAGPHAAAQAKTKEQAPAAATIQTDKDVAAIQDQLIKLLRQSPVLTTVVARDPSLLSNQEYVTKYNPQLAEFLASHPDVAKNPDYYLFNNLKRDGEGPDVALERAAWPQMIRAERQRNGWDDLLSNLPPVLGFGAFMITFIWLARLFVDNRRWTRIFNMQNQVHTKLIERFSNSQELAAYMETDAGRRFLEAAPIPVNLGTGQRVPNAVARVLTPVQIGVVLVLLGIGFLLLRHAGPDMETPMLVLGTVILMPGIGFIISAGITWLLASRLGLMPPPREAGADRFDATLGTTERR